MTEQLLSNPVCILFCMFQIINGNYIEYVDSDVVMLSPFDQPLKDSCLVSSTWIQNAHYGEGAVINVLQNVKHIHSEYRKSLLDIAQSRQRELQFSRELLYHIVDIYAFVDRIINIVTPIVEYVLEQCTTREESHCEAIATQLSHIQGSIRCSITSNDANVLVSSMLRVLEYHPLKTEDLLNGHIGRHVAINSFSCSNIWKLLITAYETGQFRLCHEHIVSFRNMLQQSTRCYRESCIADLRIVDNLHGACWNGLRWISDKPYHEWILPIHLTHLLHSWIHPLPPYDKPKGSQILSIEELEKVVDEDDSAPQYGHLCRAEGPVNSFLYCYYTRPMTGYYHVKTELLSFEPFVYRFLEVIHSREITRMKQAAIKMMVPSTLVSDDVDKSVNYRIRLSATGWLYATDDSEFMQRLNNRITFISGMLADEDNAEAFQVVNYGVAGHYSYHFDYYCNESDPNERIATWMFYLSEPPLGGNTAFPQLNLGVRPVKGSAVMWYNLISDGTYDNRSLHSGCPVIVGQKWIANKWFKVGGQWNTRKCPLDPEEREFPLIY